LKSVEKLKISRNLIKGEKIKIVDQLGGKYTMLQLIENGYSAAMGCCVIVLGT